MPDFAFLRVERIRRVIDAANATRHGLRIDNGSHYDRSRTHQNRHWYRGQETDHPVDWLAAIRETAEALGARFRKGAPLAAELILEASARWFENPVTGTWDMNRINLWVEFNLRALEARYPGMMAAARLDLDEGTPHLAVAIVPVVVKKTKHTSTRVVSYRKIFGGDDKLEARRRMIALQDWYADAMAPLGLVRGTPKAVTAREHLTHQQYAARMASIETTLAASLQDATRKVKELEEQLATLSAAKSKLERERHAFVVRAKAVTSNQKARLDWIVRAEDAVREHVRPDVERLMNMMSRRASQKADGCGADSEILDDIWNPSSRTQSAEPGFGMTA